MMQEEKLNLHKHMETIGNRIATARASLGWSQKQLADVIPCKPEQISMWERGVRHPRPKAGARLAAVLVVNYAWLMNGEGTMNPMSAPATGTDALEYRPRGESTGVAEPRDSWPIDIALLARAIKAAMSFRPNRTAEDLAQAAAEGLETAIRLGKPEKIEDLVKALLA